MLFVKMSGGVLSTSGSSQARVNFTWGELEDIII